MKKILSFFILIISLLITSCTSSTPPPRSPIINSSNEKQTQISGSIEDITSVNSKSEPSLDPINHSVADIISNYKTVQFEPRIFGDSISLVCADNIYIRSYSILLLNKETGCLQKLCADPLCKHDNTSCIDSITVNSMITDGEKIYLKGFTDVNNTFSVSGTGDRITVIASYDPKTGKTTLLDNWPVEKGSVSYELSLHDNNLYYLRRLSDTNNSLYRLELSSGKVERVNKEEDFIVQFSIHDQNIYYRNSSFTLKRMSIDGDDLQNIAENICIAHYDVETSLLLSSINDNGYTLYINDSPFIDKVYSPVDTIYSHSNKTLWYTMSEKIVFGTYLDAYNKEHSLVSNNGTKLYKYDFSKNQKTTYDMSFGFGVSKFFGMIDNYLFVAVTDKDNCSQFWLVNADNTEEHYLVYEK